MKKHIVYLLLLFPFFCFAKINIKKSSSTLRVGSGANFIEDNQIIDFSGKFIKDAGANVSGGKIVFTDGVYSDDGNKVKLNGELDLSAAGEIILGGGKSYKGKRGQAIKKLKVKGLSNRLEGILQFAENIELQDKITSLTCALQGRVPCNILLNGGKVFLEEDLHFSDDTFFTGSGVIQLNGRKIKFGGKEMTCNSALYFDEASDIELSANLHLAETWTFSGVSVLEGNGKILYLETGGEIVVENGSSLLMDNITVRNVSGNKIRCMDSSGTLTLQDVIWVQDGNYSFTTGALEVVQTFRVKGINTFAYQSAQTSKIYAYGKLIFDLGSTFSFDPIYNTGVSDWNDAKKFLTFEDDTAILELKGATLHVTSTGMQLMKGTVVIKDDSYLENEGTTESEGIIFGDGISSSNDVDINFEADAKLKIVSGYVVDKNLL